jgi:hypothetical protein
MQNSGIGIGPRKKNRRPSTAGRRGQIKRRVGWWARERALLAAQPIAAFQADQALEKSETTEG